MQLRKSFPLDEAAKITSYLDDLGVSHIYLSPILEARPESNHGYDGIDPLKISEERGGEEGFTKLVEQVEKAKSIDGLILDIVPNHVASSWLNPVWWEVLKNGPESEHWAYFDFRPRAPKDNRVVLPVLGRSRQALLASRELQFGVLNHQFVLNYWDNHFPIAPRSYARILRALATELNESSAKGAGWKKQVTKFAEKAAQVSGQKTNQTAAVKAFCKWLEANPVAARVFDITLKALPIKIIEATIDEQNYALEDWRAGSREVNYRRFFDINDLAAIRVEDDQVFKWAHKKILALTKQYPMIHGLRVDHVDGLTDPEGYLKKLRGISKHVWVEKILGEGESVPKAWPIEGTTGYEFSGLSSRLFVDLPGVLHLHSHYTRHVDRRWERFHDCVYDSKREMLDSHFVSEVNYLTDQFYALAQSGAKSGAKSSAKSSAKSKEPGSFTRDDLKEALKELTSSLRVYRTYFASGDSSENQYLKGAFAEVEGRGRLTSKQAFNWLRSLLLSKPNDRKVQSEPAASIIKRWEQLTGPVMAKGLEDTALYRYFPLLSLNVVGGEPDWTGDGAIEFHAFNQERLREQPNSMSATSTHDTKRSEDVRSRIHVLSELAEEWTTNFERWHKMNESIVVNNKGRVIPDRSIEYLIYETLTGTWPMDSVITQEYIERIKQYLLKAVREAKSETSWTEPDKAYEDAVTGFIDALLDTKSANKKAVKHALEFQKDIQLFANQCMYFGAFNSLSLVALKVTAPGLPDFYQGCELWDDSLVDPDNRRPVDYDLRKAMLKEIKANIKTNGPSARKRLTADWSSGEIKLWLTHELLQMRRRETELFTKGEYFAIEPKGEGRRHFLCFLRNFENKWALIIVPRFLASVIEFNAKSFAKKKPPLVIEDETILATEFPLPEYAPKKWVSALTGQRLGSVPLIAGDLLENLPIAVYFSEE